MEESSHEDQSYPLTDNSIKISIHQNPPRSVWNIYLNSWHSLCLMSQEHRYWAAVWTICVRRPWRPSKSEETRLWRKKGKQKCRLWARMEAISTAVASMEQQRLPSTDEVTATLLSMSSLRYLHFTFLRAKKFTKTPFKDVEKLLC